MLEFKNSLKKTLKFWGIIYLVILLLAILFSIFCFIVGLSNVMSNLITLQSLFNDIITGITDMLITISKVELIFALINFGIVSVIYFVRYIKTLVYQKSIGNDDISYIREIPAEYSPAIVSLILDENTESHKDYVATVLYLSMKKYIKLEIYGPGKIVFKPYNEPINLNKHERYVYDTLLNKVVFDKIKFNRLVIEDTSKLDLIKIIERARHYENSGDLIWNLITYNFIAIFLIVTVLSYITNYSPFISWIVIIGDIVFAFMKFNTLTKGKFELTEKGKEAFKKWMDFRKFIEDFTLTDEKNIEDVILYEKYLVYAISISRAKNIEKKFLNERMYLEYESLTNML